MRRVSFWTSERDLSILAGAVAFSIFVIAPLTPAKGIGNAVLGLAYLAILISGIASVARNRASAIALSTLALISASAWIFELFTTDPSAQAGRKLAAAFFCLLLSMVVFRQILRAGHVTIHRISGAVAAYLLLGLLFSFVYDAIELLTPGAFHFATIGARDIGLDNPMLYFSLTTLTTVGFGDVTPQIPLTQSLANLEALIGQLFPAILIARLVALEVSPHADQRD